MCIRDRGIQYLFYTGFAEWIQNEGYQSASVISLNLATSTDGGQSWSKDPNNPIPINNTPEGSLSVVSAKVIGDQIYVWISDTYPGIDEDSTAIGLFLFDPNQ